MKTKLTTKVVNFLMLCIGMAFIIHGIFIIFIAIPHSAFSSNSSQNVWETINKFFFQPPTEWWLLVAFLSIWSSIGIGLVWGALCIKYQEQERKET